jgi:alkylation response protein AidB-like acyl-CoA dehydrogenase
MQLNQTRTALQPTTEELISRARALVPLLAAQAEEVERNRRVPLETIEKFRSAEFFKLLQPAAFGGYERGLADVALINFELGRGCGSSAWCGSLGMAHQWFAALFPLEAQAEVWKDRDAILGGAYAPVGKCEPVDGGYRVKGSWAYTSNCENVPWFMLGVMTPAVEGGAPRPGIVLVPRAELRIVDTWHVAGLAGTGSHTVVLEEPLFVPAHRLIIRSDMVEGTAPGGRAHANPLYRMPFYAALPFCLASPAIGMAQGALDAFIQWAQGAKGQPSYVHRNLAEAAAAVDAAKLIILDRIQAASSALREGKLGKNERAAARRDQAYAVRLAVGGVNLLIEAMSAGGMDLSVPVQRHWRDATTAARHVALHWEDVSVLYGQQRLGMEPKGPY